MGLKIVYYGFAVLLALFLLYAYYMLFTAFVNGM